MAEIPEDNEPIESYTEKFQRFLTESEVEISKLRTQLENVTKIYEDINTKPSPTDKSKIEKITDAFEKINTYSSDVDNIQSKFKGYEESLFGKVAEDKDALQTKINKLKEDLSDLNKTWSTTFSTLKAKIETLLPGATSAGLAKAYQDQKESYGAPYITWSVIFILTMIGMVWFAVSTVKGTDSFEKAMVGIISRTPFFLPMIWLALFSSKQASQNKRLQQEYAYKESLAKTYEGYKREIEKLPDTDIKSEILEKLMSNLVTASGYNPSETLEKNSHNDNPPLLSFLRSTNNKEKE